MFDFKLFCTVSRPSEVLRSPARCRWKAFGAIFPTIPNWTSDDLTSARDGAKQFEIERSVRTTNEVMSFKVCCPLVCELSRYYFRSVLLPYVGSHHDGGAIIIEYDISKTNSAFLVGRFAP